MLNAQRTWLVVRLKRPVVGFAVFAVAIGLGFAQVHHEAERTRHDEQALCRESHSRYDTLAAVIKTSTAISPITKQRVTPAQLAQLQNYYAGLRARLTADLGNPPTC